MKNRLGLSALALLAAGCGSIQQRVEPVAGGEEKEICVQANPAARESFLTAYRGTLEQKGFTVIVVPPGASPAGCRLLSSYSARWGWTGAWFALVHADIRVTRDGVAAGRATYDSAWTGGMEGMLFASDKIVELVDQLFPYR
jgi:hypothetical protein